LSATRICPLCNTQYEDDQRFCQRDGSTLKSISGAADLVGSILADRYHVISKLGEGGMGQVYLAEHVRMGRKSAVKVMHPGMVNDADAVSRFNREAANASRISHPNVAAIYDFGETSDGLIYLAMEFIEGEPLTSVIERTGALSPARAGTIIRQTGDALAAAHDLGIVHRDLKPDNIMVARNRDGSDCVKVVDFGIAKAAHVEAQKVTRTGLIVGTPEYMSPEQLAGDPLDGRSDVYSLALVAFATLTGRLPFPSETAQESMIMRLTERPRSLAEMKPGVHWPPQLQSVMDRALSRDAATRYPSAADFGRDFAAAIEGMPEALADAGTSIIARAPIPATVVGAAPTVIGTTSARPASRRPRRAPLLLGAGAVIVGGAVVFGVLRSSGVASQPRGSSAAATGAPNGAARLPAPVRADSSATSPSLPATPHAAKSVPSGGVDALSPEAIKAEITAIKDLKLGDQSSTEAIRRAEALLPRLRSGNDSAEVLLHESDAWTTQGDQTNACNTLKRIGKRGNSIVRESVVSGLQICSTT
jgi:serine/threonine-protein kinase